MTTRRVAHSPSELTPQFRPMSEFDPSEPALVHDLRQDRLLPWCPSFQRSYTRTWFLDFVAGMLEEALGKPLDD